MIAFVAFGFSFSRHRQDPDFASKIIPINGDIYEPELGISAKDVKTLEDNVSIVYHSAASVRFDDPIRLAVEMNVRSGILNHWVCHCFQ